LIVVDISRCNPIANSAGLQPRIKLRQDKFVRCSPRRWIYDVTQNVEFFDQPQNQGNMVRNTIDYLRLLDKAKYQVRALLVGFSMKIILQGTRISAPKGAFMMVDHEFPDLAIHKLALEIYPV